MRGPDVEPPTPTTAYAIAGTASGAVSALMGVLEFLNRFSSGEPMIALSAVVVVTAVVGAILSGMYVFQFRRLFGYYGRHPKTIDAHGEEHRRVRNISYLTVLASVGLALSAGGVMFLLI